MSKDQLETTIKVNTIKNEQENKKNKNYHKQILKI